MYRNSQDFGLVSKATLTVTGINDAQLEKVMAHIKDEYWSAEVSATYTETRKLKMFYKEHLHSYKDDESDWTNLK